MASYSVSGREAARRLVQNIAKEHGYLGEEVYATMTPETRRTVQEAFLMAYKLIGASVLTLAKNLYTKDVRWIFELLQNAEDNEFSRAASSGSVPYVSFKAYKDRVVVECNEDGFTEENLRAICKVGESSKIGAQGYIGEKGIGFKSVFKAAWKVHIQSGYYSFTFTHRKGDSGMGMISPEWCEPAEDMPIPLTRITLFLHPNGVPGTEDARRQNILNQLNELKPTMLLFLKKLKKIEVRTNDDDENEISRRLLSISEDSQSTVRILNQVSTENGSTTNKREQYHIEQLIARNLSQNENRTYTPQEEALRVYGTAPVVLAFPLSDEYEPIIEQQEIFAFLPVRREGFSFLIHSDFVTQANREDIVTTSLRNIQLLDYLADAFVASVEVFCVHSTLRFTWMRYLPKLADYPWDPFWLKLVKKIKDRICSEYIMISRHSGIRRKISQTRRIRQNMLDRHKLPLFEDFPGLEALYLSDRYKPSDLRLLQDYGLNYLRMVEWLRLVERDLSSDTSRMRSMGTDIDWHARVARTLGQPFINKQQKETSIIKSLELIPLIDGKWVSSDEANVYFATTPDGFRIPTDLGFHLIDPNATDVHERKQLFLHLGAEYASVDDVRVKIIQRYGGREPNGINYKTSLSHLEFLYLTHDQASASPSVETYSKLWLYDEDGYWHPLARHTSYSDIGFREIYLSIAEHSDDPDETNETDVCDGIGQQIYRDPFYFIRKDYFRDGPRQATEHDLTWREWLRTCLGIRNYARLVNRNGSGLSVECILSSVYIRCEFLNLLKQSWASEKDRLTRELKTKLGQRIVQGQNSLYEFPIARGYLPSPMLLKIHGEFKQEGEMFPFFELGEESGSLSEWEFLHDLGAKSDPDLKFDLEILTSKLELYEEDPTAQAERSKSGGRLQYVIPTEKNQKPNFAKPSECILDGTMGMETVYPVIPLYKAQLGDSIPGFSALKEFFQETLKIPKCSWKHIVEELKHLKESDSVELYDKSGDLYSELSTMRLSSASLEEMKNAFKEDALVFADVGPQKWHKAPQCLWCAPSPIRGRVNLSDLYDKKLERFFIEKLGVRTLDAGVVYNELLELNPEETTVQQAKDLLWTFNSQIELNPPDKPPDGLLERRILPVREVGGQITLTSAATDFGIVNRRKLGDIFHDRVKILDFTVNEVVKLKPLIKWAGIENRYLSRSIQETSVLDPGFKVPISDPTEDIRRKAYGLLRIAAHFQSPRIVGDGQELYDLLRNSCTWETQNISTTLVLSIGSETVSQVIDRGLVHIDDTDGLEIYVPHDEDLRDQAYLSILPNRLAKWIMTDPITKLKNEIDSSMALLIHGVLMAKPRKVDYYLTENGIVEVTIPEQDDQEDAIPRQSTPTLASSPTAVGPSTPSTPRTLRSPSVEPITPLFENDFIRESIETPATEYTPRSAHGEGSARYHPSSSQESPSPDPFTTPTAEQRTRATEEYRGLLSQVVRIAKSSRLLSEALDLHELLDAISSNNVNNRVFNEYNLFNALFGGGMPQIERDKRVGAAGELFVFELLSSMNPSLRGFTRANWTSTIRRYVTVHPDYEDMSAWSGIETSDLEYEDVDGRLTAVLISKGHLRSEWRGLRPKYYIEVKTTPGARDAPFFMSDAQYHKMKRLCTNESLYVIFRVSDLYTGGLTVDIYVDPVKLANEGRLVFTADKWTVKPVLRF
ncbi:hypothetical protein Daesc_001154 [Daldinia eschscholtzii]|uniref:Protein NO VEIN C-terminal domain-containing protein n=1 Tax=Daldinia eschscholtzii TaxID=292717 RepID=A0AAX6N0G8_9PEZI